MLLLLLCSCCVVVVVLLVLPAWQSFPYGRNGFLTIFFFLLSPQFLRDQKGRNSSFEQGACYAGLMLKKVTRSDFSL